MRKKDAAPLSCLLDPAQLLDGLVVGRIVVYVHSIVADHSVLLAGEGKMELEVVLE